MPILNVEIVLRRDELLKRTLAQEIADAAGEVFDSLPGQTWVKITALEPDAYAENGGVDPGIAPVFVSIIKGKLPERTALEPESKELTVRIAQICNRPPENVHLIYEPEGLGRVVFGGNLVD